MNPFSRIMNAVGAFFLAAAKSCYDMEWYRTVRERPLSAALRYAVACNAALALFMSAMLASYIFGAETAFIVHVIRTFPDGAALSVKGGHLATNLSEPFEAGSKWVRVVIDTSVEGYEVPARYDGLSGALVGKDAIFMPKSYAAHTEFMTHRGLLRFKGLSEFTVTKTGLLDGLRIWGGLAIFCALFVFTILNWPYLILKTTVAAAVVAAVALVAGRALGVRLPYKKWFIVGLYASTLPSAASFAVWAINVRIPFLYALLICAYMAAVLADEFVRSGKRWTPAVIESMFFSSDKEAASAPRRKRRPAGRLPPAAS